MIGGDRLKRTTAVVMIVYYSILIAAVDLAGRIVGWIMEKGRGGNVP